MATWRIVDITMVPKKTYGQASHSISLVLEETDAEGKTYLYTVIKGPDSTKAEFLADFKKQVLRARALRAKLEAIKSQINVNQIEAFLAQ